MFISSEMVATLACNDQTLDCRIRRLEERIDDLQHQLRSRNIADSPRCRTEMREEDDNEEEDEEDDEDLTPHTRHWIKQIEKNIENAYEEIEIYREKMDQLRKEGRSEESLESYKDHIDCIKASIVMANHKKWELELFGK